MNFIVRKVSFSRCLVTLILCTHLVVSRIGCANMEPNKIEKAPPSKACASSSNDSLGSSTTSSHLSTPALNQMPPLKICFLVEPSPFTYVSGYANRYQETFKFLKQADDKIQVVTTDANTHHTSLPKHFLGYPIQYTLGVPLPMYKHVTLSLDFQLNGLKVIRKMKPDVIHVSTPGFMVFPAIVYSRLFRIPLVMSYHTHLPIYVKKYVWEFVSPVVQRLSWFVIWAGHCFADLTLVTSPQIQQEFVDHEIPRVDVWRKGIDTERFHPQYRNDEMRYAMTNGHPHDFLILYVGRLAAEKRVEDLKAILDHLLRSSSGSRIGSSNTRKNVRLCLVGTGPQEDDLKEMFKDTTTDSGDSHVVFMGQLVGERLSMAYASADVFVLPSDSETLGFVVLESMASGVPVIAARAGGVPSLIQDGITSYLVTPGCISEFCEKLELLNSNPTTVRSRMGQLARCEAEKWGWESATSILRNEQYQQALKNCKRRC